MAVLPRSAFCTIVDDNRIPQIGAAHVAQGAGASALKSQMPTSAPVANWQIPTSKSMEITVLRQTFTLLLVVAASRTANAQQAQQVLAPGDSIRWSEIDSRQGQGRVLTVEPAGLMIRRLGDTVNLSYANLKKLDRYKKPPVSRIVLITAAMAAGAATAAFLPKKELLCDDDRCVETMLNERSGNPVVFAAAGAAFGLGFATFAHKVKPGPWKAVFKR